MATADFFSKVIAATPASSDDEHVPLLIQSDPRIPSRPGAILHAQQSPLPALMEGRDRLIAAGAKALAMPCNTAHFWYPDLVKDCPVPFLNIVDATCSELSSNNLPGAKVGIIATRATLAAHLFDSRLEQAGFVALLPDEVDLETRILPAIKLVKGGDLQSAGTLIAQSIDQFTARGATAIILACTETPIALDAVQSPLRSICIDSTAALARACVRWWQTHQSQSAG